ncbi:MAG: hypothetical protein ACYC9V_00895 [Desulfobacteria bacterium]
MKIRWPSKDDREKYEIHGFILAYSRLNSNLNLIIEAKRERPDYIIRDQTTGQRFGVELTSVYLDNRSVPDVHKKPITGVTDISYDELQIDIYQKRLVEAINTKISKARKGYDINFPLILSVYVNEYICIYTDKEDWELFVKLSAPNHRLKLTGSRGGNPECPRLSLIVMRTVVYSKNIGPCPVVN